MAKLKLFYGGVRMHNDKLWHVFYKPDGKIEGYWKGLKRVWIGSSYFAEGEAYGDKKITLKARPDSAGDHSHPDEDKWNALDKAARMEHKGELLKKKAQNMKGLLDDVEKIKRFVKGLSFSDRRFFVDWILDQIAREETERMNRALNARIKALNKSANRALQVQAKKHAKELETLKKAKPQAVKK